MDSELSRAEVDAMRGPTVLEFGAGWCSICRGTRPLIDRELDAHPGVRYLRVEDGKGKPLGRSFRVKLWPTLIFLQDGKEVARVVRPAQAEELAEAFTRLAAVPARVGDLGAEEGSRPPSLGER